MRPDLPHCPHCKIDLFVRVERVFSGVRAEARTTAASAITSGAWPARNILPSNRLSVNSGNHGIVLTDVDDDHSRRIERLAKRAQSWTT